MNRDSITPEPAVYWLNNPFDLTDIDRYPVHGDITIRQWLADNGSEGRLNYLPTVCVYDGKELLRAEYDQTIDGPVCFVTLPTGGDSGSNPLAAIAMIAMSVFVPGMVAGWGGMFATKTGLTFVGSMVSAGIMMGGAMLISAVFPPPGLPNSASPSAGSPTYSLGAQGNAARLGSPIPVNYGRMRIYPDFAAQPYSEYQANEQYLYQLFCIGQGENQISDIRLEDTPIENFAEVTTEVVPPLGKVTLFHTAVVTAAEAGGQEMSKPITLGPYILNDTGTEISRIAVDVVFPGGLMGVDEDDGDEYSVGVHLNITAELVDDDGDPTGSGITVFSGTISDCTRTAIRRTLSKDVAPGRYRVTVSRTTGESPSHEVTNCSLGAIKGFLVDDNEYGDVTLLAMRVRASANLSDSASRMVNVMVERLIPVWSEAGWSQPRLTRNPAWAFADAVRARYGGDFADSELDLNGLLYLAGLFDQRGDKFDGRFDTEQSLWDGLGKIGQVCRSGPVRQGNLIRFIRDQQIDVPSQVFGMANMSDFSVDYVMHDDRTADAVKITYWDETRDYSETTITCQLPNDTADNPQEVTLFGCTQYEQAWREGMYLAASNRERRQMVSWTTGLEGHIPTFGDLVIINHDLMGAGAQFGGVVEAVDGALLTLSSDVNLDGEHWYCILRDRHGEPSAPLPIEAAAPNRVRVLDTLPYIETDTSREPTHYLIGQGSKVSWPVKITAITPEADNKITIAGCIESEFVHTVDEGVLPPPPPDIKPPPPGLVIHNLLATQGGTVHAPVIFLSWDIAVGADRYVIEYSTDGRETWQPAGAGQSFINQHEFAAEVGLLTCRVAAVGAIRGEWAEIAVNAGGDFDTPGIVQPELVEPFTGDALKVRWDPQPAAARYVVRIISHGTGVRSLYLERNITEYHYHYTDAQQDAAGRTITVRVAAENGNGVLGEYGELTATNPPPAAPTGLIVDPLIDSFIVRANGSDDTDIREFRVYGTQDAGFVPGIDNLLYANPTPWASLNLKGRWYFRAAWVDQWGATELNYSAQASGDSGAVDLGPVEDELADLNDKIGIVGGDIVDLDNKLSAEIDKVEIDLSGTQQAIADLDAQTDKDLADVRNDLLADIDTSIKVEEAARKSADEALSKRITTVGADLSDEVTDRKAAVQSEATARAKEDEALASRIDTVAADLSTETADRTAAIQQEATVRAREDETLAQQITTVSSELDDEVADRKAAIQQEATARTSADESLARQINQVQAGFESGDSELDAAIRDEAEARANEDSALASRISTVIADYKKGDQANSAAIQTETTARTNADNALGRRIDTVVADYKKGDQANSAAIQQESEARADADEAIGRRVDTVQASVGTISKLGRNADFSQKGKYWSLSGTGETVPENLDGSWSNSVTVEGGWSYWVKGKEQFIYSANAIPVDVNRTYRVRFRVRQWKDPTTSGKSKVYAGVACLDANFQALTTSGHRQYRRYCAVSSTNITQSQGWRYYEGKITGVGDSENKFSHANVRFIRLIGIVNYQGGNGEALIDLLEFEDVTDKEAINAAIQEETEARVSADQALSRQISTVVSDFEAGDADNSAAIQTEKEARTSVDTALGKRIDTVTANYQKGDRDNLAAIQTEVTARTNADSALGKRIDTVTANYQSGDRTNSAAIQAESEARADADGALGKRIDTVQAVANGNKATVQQHTSAIATIEDGVEKLETSWGVTLDVNGYVSGFAMNNDGDSSEALFRADTFAIGSPGVKELTFVVKDGAVMMPGLSIVDGSITAVHLAANSVTADKIAANTITGNEISSATTITAGTGNATAGMNGGTYPDNPAMNDVRFWAGSDSDNITNAPFKVLSNGVLKSVNGEFSGSIDGSTINGSSITGGVIEGAVIISSGSVVVSTTDADRGAGTIRYLYERGETVDIESSSGFIELPVASYNYTGDGTIDYEYLGADVVAYKNFIRFKSATVHINVVVEYQYAYEVVCRPNSTSGYLENKSKIPSNIRIDGITAGGSAHLITTWNPLASHDTVSDVKGTSSNKCCAYQGPDRPPMCSVVSFNVVKEKIMTKKLTLAYNNAAFKSIRFSAENNPSGMPFIRVYQDMT